MRKVAYPLFAYFLHWLTSFLLIIMVMVGKTRNMP